MNNMALIDMDGTIADYHNTIEQTLNKLVGKAEGVDRKAITDLIRKVPGFWRTLPKIELGFKIVEILKEFDFQLHILTKGPYKTTSAWTEKVEWVREYLPGVPITITEDKGLVYGKILVDDWPEYCEKWLKWRPRGLVIMPSYEYNYDFAVNNSNNVIRANDNNLDQIRKAIERVAKRQPGETL